MNQPDTPVKNGPLFGILLCILCLSGLAIVLLQQQEAQNLVSIQQNGEEIYEIDLNTVKTPYFLEIEGDNGIYNVVKVQAGQISISEANCPDQICVLRGDSDGSGGPIVCLPHKIIIRFSGEIYDEISG